MLNKWFDYWLCRLK